MPAYDKEHASDEELNALVAYIRSLKKGDTPKLNEGFRPPVGPPVERRPSDPKEPQPGDPKQARLEPLKLREGDPRPITRPELPTANSPELHPEDIRPDPKRFPPLYVLPVAPPPREK